MCDDHIFFAGLVRNIASLLHNTCCMQVCVYHAGVKVVDLVGGCMDLHNTVPVMPSTLSQIMSATKGAG